MKFYVYTNMPLQNIWAPLLHVEIFKFFRWIYLALKTYFDKILIIKMHGLLLGLLYILLLRTFVSFDIYEAR